MLTVYTCLTAEHDLRLVALAALVCLLSSGTTMALCELIRKNAGPRRWGLASLAAVIVGTGIWATHFIALLAFEPNLPHGYAPAETLLSLLAVIVILFPATLLAGGRQSRFAPLLGGVLFAIGVGIMHFLGMAAFRTEGRLLWNHGLVILSLTFGAVLAVSAFTCCGKSARRRVAGAILLTSSVIALHFTAMAACAIIPDPEIGLPRGLISSSELALWVAAAASALLAVSAILLAVARQHHRSEDRHLRELADAAVEGLAILEGEQIVTVNRSLGRLLHASPEQLIDTQLSDVLDVSSSDIPDGASLAGRVRTLSGETIPVELICHSLSMSSSTPRRVLAIRDLRARIAADMQMRHLALHDGLTGLPNRLSFTQRLGRELAERQDQREHFALLCLDLDRFKQVNDTLGHAAGDLVLQSVAKLVATILSDRDHFVRLGGDEFAIIRTVRCELPELAEFCQHILELVSKTIAVEGQRACVGMSIGVALFPQHGEDADALVSSADAALYQAKGAGRNCYSFYNADLGARLKDRHALEQDLGHALARNELHLRYQPQTNIMTGEVIGFEALIRWTHPVRGEISPGKFIPLAEETGAIIPIGEWVVREACREAASWPKPLSIAVNLSGAQFASANLADCVCRALREARLAPHRLEIEITETALIGDMDSALDVLRRLKSLGVRVALDDFGTGFSSLANLRAFPFDKVKIDQSFVRDVHRNRQSATIVRAILGLCRGLELSVMAEGVETDDELAFLHRELCVEAQGFLLGRPGEVREFPNAFDVAEAKIVALR